MAAAPGTICGVVGKCTRICRLSRNSEKKPIKNFGKSSRLPKIFREPIHNAHRAAVFAIAQLSCVLNQITKISCRNRNNRDLILPITVEARRSFL